MCVLAAYRLSMMIARRPAQQRNTVSTLNDAVEDFRRQNSAAGDALDEGGGFAPCQQAKPGAPVWRRDDEAGQSYALKLTAAGAKAIAIDESAEPAHVGNEGDSREDVEQAGSCSQRPSAPRSFIGGSE